MLTFLRGAIIKYSLEYHEPFAKYILLVFTEF